MQDPTSGLVIGAAICAGLTVWLTVPPRIDPAPVPARAVPGASRRPQWAPVAAAFGTWAFVGGVQGVVIAAVVGVVVAVIVARAEDPHARRHRVAVERQLPHVVLILGSALKAGAPVGRALEVVGEAFPGPAADQLADVTARLHLGVDPAVARRKTIYRFDTSKRVSAVHEICCFRLSQDTDRLIAVAEMIVLRALGIVD